MRRDEDDAGTKTTQGAARSLGELALLATHDLHAYPTGKGSCLLVLASLREDVRVV